LDRDTVRGDDVRQCDHHRMPRFARVEIPQLPAPPGEQLAGSLTITDLISQVIRPATEGINRLKGWPQSTGRQPGDDAEALVMLARETGTIVESPRWAQPFGGVGTESPEVVGKGHEKTRSRARR